MISLLKRCVKLIKKSFTFPKGMGLRPEETIPAENPSSTNDFQSNYSEVAYDNPLRRFFKHKITNNYIFINSSISSTTFEFVDDVTINILNALTIDQIRENLMARPSFTDYDHYAYYPRASMPTIKKLQIREFYEPADPYVANTHYSLFHTECIKATERINRLKPQILELINMERERNGFNYIQPAEVNIDSADLVKAINKSNLESQQQLNIDRFDKII